MSALRVTFYIGLGISVLALVISYFRGGASLDEAIRARPGDRVASEPHPQAPIPTSRNVEALEVSQWGETASHRDARMKASKEKATQLMEPERNS